MSAIDQFAQDLTTQRTGTIGSAMSRLESIQNNLPNQSITYNSALSQIRDADLSSAVVDLTRAKVLQQYQVALFQQASILQASTRLSILG
jgi:flagellin-like hook-associated protein FlgL